MRLALALAAGLAFGPFAAAQAPPAPEKMRAMRDSPFMRQLLREPMPTDPVAAMEPIRLLLLSGNGTEAELLQRARGRIAVAQLTGEVSPPAVTIGEAIERENTDPAALVEVGRRAMARVLVGFPPGPPNVSVTPESATHSRVTVTLRATNGLRAPVTELVALAGPNDYSRGLEALGLHCKPLGAPTGIAPGESADLACEGGRATEQLEAPVQALKARAPLGMHTVDTPVVVILNGQVIARSVDDRAGDLAAMARLAALPCEQKGSCATIATESRRSWREQNGPQALVAWAAGAFALAALLAVIWRPAVRETLPGAIGGIALTLFSLFGLATAWAGLVGGNAGYGALVGYVVLYYGALPFLAVFVALGSSLFTYGRTRLRVFAVAFSALSAALVVAASRPI